MGFISLSYRGDSYLNGGENCRYIISRTPSVLQNIETNATISIDIGMEHFRNKANCGRFVRILFSELYS